jgi:GDPmannose 4,6-dehydratase
MWRILQQDTPDDYVLATNETHTVREFCQEAFAHVGLDWEQFVRHDPRYERPAEVDLLIGDPSKAKRQLGWEPTVKFHDLVRLMVDADLATLDGVTATGCPA